MTGSSIRSTVEGALSDFDSIPPYWQRAVDRAIGALEDREAALATTIAEAADNAFAANIIEVLDQLEGMGMQVKLPTLERSEAEKAALNAELDRRIAEWKSELGI